MKDYDNMMDKVRNKATDIRDKIMEWLGFTKRINPFTNEISWEYTGMSKTAKMILTALKAIVAIGIIAKLVKALGVVQTLIGVLKGSIAPTTAFQVGLASIGKTMGDIKAGASATISTFKGIYKATEGNGLTKFATALKTSAKEAWSLIPAVVKVAGGIAGLLISFNAIAMTTRKMSEANEIATSSYVKLALGMGGAIASGAVIGSVILPGIGTAIGAVVGGLVGLTAGFIGWQTEAEKYHAKTKENKKATDEYFESIEKTSQAIKDNANSQMAYVDYAEKLSNELDKLVDEEGKVKAGMEERVKFILGQLNEAMGTEYKLVGDHIENYKDLSSSIKQVIENKRAEIVLNAYEEEYADAIKRQAELQKKKRDLQLEINDGKRQEKELREKINDLDENNPFDVPKAIEYSKQLKTITEDLKTNQEELGKVNEQYVKDSETIIDWENLKEAVVSENHEKMGESMDELLHHREDNAKSTAEIIHTGIQTEIDELNNLKANESKINQDIYDEKVKKYEEGLDALLETLTTTEELIDANNPDIVEAWRKVAHFSEEKYDEYISKLPPETQKAITDAIAELDGKQPRARQAGGDLAGSTVDGMNETANDTTIGIPSVVTNIIDGLVTGLMAGAGPFGSLWGVGRILMQSFIGGVKEEGVIQSPSKKMYEIGDFLIQGLANGITDKSNVAVNAIKNTMRSTLTEASKITDGVNVNPSKYSVDVNKFIDYGSISGSISSQIDMSGSISDKVYMAVMDGLQNSTINVAIEAKTEEGVLLKRVQTQANQYRMQTGKAPFPTM